MEKKIHVAIGSVVGWEGKKYKLVSGNVFCGCIVCDLYESCRNLPFDCGVDDGSVRFEEIGDVK